MSTVSVVLMMAPICNLYDVVRFEGLVAGAALRVKELQQLLQRLGIGCVAQEGALAPHANQFLGSEFVEMMRKGGVGNIQLFLNFTDDKSLGMAFQQQLHNPKSRFGSHCRKHIGVLRYPLGGLGLGPDHISIILEI